MTNLSWEIPPLVCKKVFDEMHFKIERNFMRNIFSTQFREMEWWVLIYMKEEGKAAAATENFLLLKNFILIFNVEILFFEIKWKLLWKCSNYPLRGNLYKNHPLFLYFQVWESYNKNNNHKFMFRNNWICN